MDRSAWMLACALLVGCGHPHDGAGIDSGPNSGEDSGGADSGRDDASPGDHDASPGDHDASPGGHDASPGGHDASATGVISGGPCLSGAAGATAFRISWSDVHDVATAVYEVDGLPDHATSHRAGAYGYTIPFTPEFGGVDPGGLSLDSSDFVDLDLSTVGIANISSATLAIYGNGSGGPATFTWQSFLGLGSSAANVVHYYPYAWYAIDITAGIAGADAGTLIRIKIAPSSNGIILTRIELCLQAT